MMAFHSSTPIPAIQFTSPFDDDDADIIIRSSDKAHFRVHTLILKKASPVFSDMLQMPNGDAPETLHTVELTEDGATLTRLLQSCYMNLDFPEIDTLDQLTALLDVCDKYQMIGVARRLAEALLGAFDTTEPLRVLMLAYRAQAARPLRHAAQQCIYLSQVDLIHSNVDLRFLPASTYRSLLRYHDRCRKVASEILSSTRFLWLAGDYCWLADRNSITGSAYHHSCCCLGKHVEVGAAGATLPVRQWWLDLVETVIKWLAQQSTTSPIDPRLQIREVRAIFRRETAEAPSPCHPTGTSYHKSNSNNRRDSSCNYCEVHRSSDLDRFADELETEIERQIKAVEFMIERE